MRCPECGGELVYVGMLTYEDGIMRDTFQCRYCGHLFVLESEEVGGE